MDPVSDVFSLVEPLGKDIMIVSHLPFLQKLASLILLGKDSAIIRFNMAGVVCLEKDEEGTWQLIFEVIPDLLK